MSRQTFNFRGPIDQIYSPILNPIADHHREVPINSKGNRDLVGISRPLCVRGERAGLSCAMKANDVLKLFERLRSENYFPAHRRMSSRTRSKEYLRARRAERRLYRGAQAELLLSPLRTSLALLEIGARKQAPTSRLPGVGQLLLGFQ